MAKQTDLREDIVRHGDDINEQHGRLDVLACLGVVSMFRGSASGRGIVMLRDEIDKRRLRFDVENTCIHLALFRGHEILFEGREERVINCGGGGGGGRR